MSALEEQKPEAEIAKTEAETKTLEELEEDKLKAEIAKIKAETKALKRPAILKPSAMIPLVVAIAGLVTTTSQWMDAREGEQTAKVEEQGSQNYSMGLKMRLDLIDSLYQGVLEQNPENVAVARISNVVANLPEKVVIHFRGSLTRELMTALQGEFNRQGMPAPRPERIDGSYENNVRFFHSSDASLVDPVLNVISSFFQDKECPIDMSVAKLSWRPTSP